MLLEQGDDAARGAGTEQRSPLGQAAEVVGVEAVHVLAGIDGVDDRRGVDLGGQGELDQDAVHLLVGV